MKAKTIEKKRFLGWVLLSVMAAATALVAPGCVVVDEDDCLEGALRCSGEYVEECYNDTWVVYEDCYEFCGGTCGYLDNDTACFC